MKKIKKIICFLLAFGILFTCAAIEPTNRADAVTKKQITNLKNQRTELKKKISSTQATIDELNIKQVKGLAQKEIYDEQIVLINESISLTEEEIAEYENLIIEAQKDYDQALVDEKNQHDLMCTRIRAMEENGTISYWEVLFKSRSFSDLLSRMDFISEIMRYDEKVIEDYHVYQQQTLDRKADLNELKEESEAVKAELESEEAELQIKLEEAAALIEQLRQDEETYKAILADYEKEQKNLNTKIANAEAEYEKQLREAAAAAAATSGQGNSASGVSLSWPVSSRSITSTFGYRSAEATNGVGSTNHMGIDIGGVGYTSSVYAAASGVVTVATKSSSAGNYVAVSHGNGVRTVYMHLSSYCVKVGDSVSSGQKLGVTGSTGNSTGPHLHFGVIINGSYVDPLKYLP